MPAKTERCYRITVPGIDSGDKTHGEYYVSCLIDDISVYDRFLTFTIVFKGYTCREFLLGRTDEGWLWYFDLLDYTGSELPPGCDPEDIAEELYASNSEYSDEEILLLSYAMHAMITEYACSFKLKNRHRFLARPDMTLPF